MFDDLTSAVPTPFSKDLGCDIDSLKRFLVWQLSEGVNNFVLFGSTGEGPCVSMSEREVLIKAFNDVIPSSSNLMLGISSSNTKDSISMAKQANDLGADALMICAPYYNKPSQGGIYQHMKAVHDATDIPICIYDTPSRSGVVLSIDLMKSLSKLPRVFGVKLSTGDISKVLRLKSEAPKLQLIMGDDVDVVAGYANGASGIISVLSNVFPRALLSLIDLCKQQKYTEASAKAASLLPLIDALFCDTNPIPVKYYLYKMGLFSQHGVRLPLISSLDESQKSRIKETIHRYDLTKNKHAA